MNKLLTAMVAVLAAMFMMGCAPKERVITVIEVETIVISAPKAMTAGVETPKPTFSPEDYSKATPRRQSELTDGLIASLYTAIAVANKQLKKLESWTAAQKQLYDKKPVKEVQNE